jgi:hypothetical protein
MIKKHILVFVLLLNFLSHAQITTYSVSYGLTGLNLDQPDLQFNLETTYEFNESFTQLYRWRLAIGNYKGLLFEYNNRFYFGKDRDYDNSKWFFQAKVGYGMLKGRDYQAGTVYWTDPSNSQLVYNTSDLTDKTHFNLIYGLGMGYKFIFLDRVTFDLLVGYAGFTTPNFSKVSMDGSESRKKEWQEGIAFPLDFSWSIGFFL